MEEKERFNRHSYYPSRYIDNETNKIINIKDTLNQQDKRIKELEEENGYIIFVDGYDESDNEIHRQEFVKYKDKFNELLKQNQQLKQTQNQKAIEVLTDILVNLCSKYSTIFGNHNEPIRVLDVEQISDFINNRIKKLRGEENEL